MKVLIAEDDAVSRTIVKSAVEKFGHECLAAVDGERAWELFRSTPEVDVVISDWMMPGLDGPEFCRRVREANSGRYTFFIFLTALGDKEHLLEGMRAGADDYLAKPLDREQLQVRLIAASRVNELHRRLAEQRSELECMNRKLYETSRLDPLTGLGNRLLLREDLKILSERVARYCHTYSALLCDVDFFKLYNDSYGHLEGDRVLRQVADTIASHCRSGDTAYRYGGEELLIILPEQTPQQAIFTANRLRRAVEALRIPHEMTPSGVVTISCGVASIMVGEPKSVEDLLRETDEALYRAKESGRNRAVSYEVSD